MELTRDRLLGGRIEILQPARGFRTAIDAVLLAAAVPAKAGERALELGSGVGAAALCLARRVPGLEIEGLEIQPAFLALASENARRNRLDSGVRFLRGDVADGMAEAGGFDHVFANPPYLRASEADASPDPLKAAATVEGRAKLADWLACAAAAARPGGSILFIHRAERAAEIARGLAARARRILILPLTPRHDRAPKRALVLAEIGAAGAVPAPGAIHRLPLFPLHESDGSFTPAADSVLRGGEALSLTLLASHS